MHFPPTQSPTTASPTTLAEHIAEHAAEATGDLHIHHAGGGTCDVRGEHDGVVANMIQTDDMSLNCRFKMSNFSLAPEDTRSDSVAFVDGSHLEAAFVTATTMVGGKVVMMKAAYDTARPSGANVVILDTLTGAHLFDAWLTEANGAVVFGSLSIVVRDSDKFTLVIANMRWKYTIIAGTYRTFADAKRHKRIDVAITALIDPLSSVVAPHGLLGQGFDMLHIDGKVDNYMPDREGGVYVTSAQGEGAIEGTVADYTIHSNDPFDTNFKFSRFGKSWAAPRNVSKLNTPVGATTSSAGAD